MNDRDQKLIFEAYHQQLNEIGGGGFNPSGTPEDIGSETFDQDDEYGHVQDLIDAAIEERGHPVVGDDDGWDQLFNSIYETPDFEDQHSDILSELINKKRNELEVQQSEIQSALPGADMDMMGNAWNPYN